MKYHHAIWQSICYIAQINNTTCSGLAKMCGLDATIFNPSKRKTAYGQPRWISTATLAKVLTTTNISPIQFAEIVQMFLDENSPPLRNIIMSPLKSLHYSGI